VQASGDHALGLLHRFKLTRRDIGHGELISVPLLKVLDHLVEHMAAPWTAKSQLAIPMSSQLKSITT
jgi:hypothetical protein